MEVERPLLAGWVGHWGVGVFLVRWNEHHSTRRRRGAVQFQLVWLEEEEEEEGDVLQLQLPLSL